MIEVDHATASAGLKTIRDATAEFDEAAAAKNPSSLDAGDAQALLADVLTAASEIALRLVYELDSLADNADDGLDDLAAFDEGSGNIIDALGWGLK